MFKIQKVLNPLILGQTLFTLNTFAQEEMKDYQLKQGETITDALWDHGLKPIYGSKGVLIKILNANDLTLKDAKRLKPGQTLKMPADIYEVLMKDSPVKVAIPNPVAIEVNHSAQESQPEISFEGATKTAIYNLKKNETITDALWNRGFKPLYGPKGILTKILKFNNVTFNEAKHLRPGYPLKVPVVLHEALMKPVPPKVEKPEVIPVPVIEPEQPSAPWNYSTNWAAGIYYFHHNLEEKNDGEFVKTLKEQQLGLDFRNYSQIHKLSLDGQFFISKIHGASFPVEFGVYERVTKTDFSFAHVSPFFTVGYEQFSYLGGDNSEVVIKDFNGLMLGAGLKWEFNLAHRSSFLSFEYLKTSHGSFLHPWMGINLNERFFSELHFYKMDFENGADVKGNRLNLNLGYRF